MKKFFALIVTAAALFAATDINHASLKELESVKGIGPKKARLIVEYREKHCFGSVDELIRVKGIGRKSLEKLKPHLTATPCKRR